MVARLFLNNKLLPYCGPFASFLVLNTIGVYHQHHTCGASTHLLKEQKRGLYNHYNKRSKTIMTT